MADDRDETIGNTAPATAAEPRPVALSRRAVLRGATAAVPTILTLKSGTAMAVASSHVTATTDPVAKDNQFVALDTTGQGGPAYDYRDGTVYLIPADGLFVDRSTLTPQQLDHLVVKRNGLEDLQVLRADEICTNAGVSYLQVEKRLKNDNKYAYFYLNNFNVPKCAYLSVSAWNSVALSGETVLGNPLI